jgi:hypothetical protein
MLLGPLSYTIYTGIFTMKTWIILKILMISIIQVWPWGLELKLTSAGGNKL